MNDDWRAAPIRLRYRLGEVTCFTAVFEGLIFDRHFSELEADQLPPLPVMESGARAPLCVIRSQPVSQALPRISAADGWIRYIPHQYKRYYVDLRGGFDAYLKHFSSKTRSTLTRKVRKFAEASGGEIDWREYRSPEELEKFFAAARELSRKTYQERLLESGLPADEEFRRSVADAARRSEVRAYLLFLSGQPVAYVFCPLKEGVLTYEFVGFDPDHHHLSPGTILQYQILKRLFDEGGYRMFDFTEGEGQQKALFATHNVYCADIYLYRDTWANSLAVRLHAAVDRVSARAASALDRVGLKSVIKRFVRRTA